MAIGWDGDEEELAQLTRRHLHPRLMRLKGVADVMIFSKEDKDVLIEFDQDALRSTNTSIYQIVNVLQRSSLNVSVGEMAEAGKKYFVRALGEFQHPDEIAQLVIGPNALRLKDVAKVGYRSRAVDMEYTIDGMRGVFMLIRKESEANTIATCQAIRREIEASLQEPMFEGVTTFTFMDQSELILSALDSLLEAGRYGGALAVVVLFLFLRRVRPTLVVAFAIPVSVIAGLVFMFFAGMTLNIITMISMIIALGMLVDNSIVVIENIYRYQQLGLDSKESARRGASEVGMAITAATLTTLVVFIPMLYLETGEMATYMRQFAAPVTVALIASLVVALTVIPLAASRLKMRRATPAFVLAEHPEQDDASGTRIHPSPLRHPLAWLIHTYSRCLAWTMRWRLATALLILLLIVVTLLVPYRYMKRQGMPRVDMREINIEIDLDQNFDMAGATELFESMRTMIDESREELGIKNVFLHYTPTGGSIYAYLVKPEDLPLGEKMPYTTQEVLDILWQRIPERTPGAEFQFSIAEANENASGGFSVRMRGEDADILDAYAERFKVLLDEMPEIDDVFTNAEREKQEVQLKVNDRLAEEMGVSAFAVAQTVDFALRGSRLAYLKRDDREVPVWAQFREEDRKSRANLDNVAILSARGDLVPLNQLVSMSKAKSPSAIHRVDGKNVVVVTAKTFADDMVGLTSQVKGLIESFEMPRGYSIDQGDEMEELAKNLANFILALVLAIILIYIVMGSLFESYLLPLSILTTVPLAAIGICWAMFLTNTPVDTVTLIGVILLMGIVVNNGIVIVDHINQLRNAGMARTQAILQAGRDRFRPVMMTALTTILGCVPLAVGSTIGKAVAFNSLGRALIGGLTTGTVLTLFVVPLFYTFVDDMRVWFLHYFADLAGLKRRRPAAPAVDAPVK
jgi:HAE1 family hydrophobic/amphiphilic exporter-1